MPRSRAAFTLIEMLVVILVIVILVGLILGAVGAAKRSMLRGRTASILATIRVGLEATGAERGGLPAGAPHPLASTNGSRLKFIRGEAGSGFAIGAAVAQTGEALTIADPSQLEPSAVTQLTLGSDVFQDDACPAFWGVPRRSLTVLNGGAGLVRIRTLPELMRWNDMDKNGKLDLPYDRTRYNDNSYLQWTGDDPAKLDTESARAISYAFSQVAHDELAGLGALVTNLTGAAIMNGRLREAAADDRRSQPPQILDSGTWKTYSLRGTAIYDAWGREILYSLGTDGKTYTLISAGIDGYYGNSTKKADGALDNVIDGRKSP